MNSDSLQLPESLKARFADHLPALETRYRSSARFREICADYEELTASLAESSSSGREADDLQSLAHELEAEILLELVP